MSVYIEHGTADPVIPSAGGEAGTRYLHHRGTSFATDREAALWRKVDRLPETARTVRVPHLHADDRTSANRLV